ncbi:MAG TPA: iron ABC transporter permease [Chloroflexota bacterium]|nr:iron ABC transporter permease [Chloroflexota bacterium]
MASLSLPLALRRRRAQLDGTTIGYTALLALLGLLVLYPVAMVVLSSFQTSRPGQAATWSLDAWRTALGDPSMVQAVWNTVLLMLAQHGLSLPIAVALAWVLARTDLPGAHWLEFAFWIAFFLPALPVTLGWILLLDPEYGLLNQVVAGVLGHGVFNIYSFWGIVWAHIAHSSIAVKVMLLTPAFRNLDASLEEASRISGASTLGTVWRVVVPVMAPALLVVALLAAIHSMQAFEVEAILGPPFQFFIFSTKVYRLINQEPPLFAAATALSTSVLVLVMPLIFLQRWMTTRRSYTTVSGQFRGGKVRLGRWRRPVFALVLGVALLITVVPFTFLMLGTFMKLFGFFNLPQPWTTEHWGRVFGDPIFLTSVRNTLAIALGTAVVAVALFSLIAYVAVRTRYAARGALDFISWFPSTLPGIILGLGLLWVFLGNPLLRPLYGTLAILIVATVISTMTLGVQIIKSHLVQFSFELEEAARIGGGGWWHVYQHVVLPLLMPVLLLVGAVSFISAARNVSTVALLATSGTRPLSLLQLDFMVEGRYEAAAVVGVIVVLLTTGIALIARVFGLRVGVRE